MPAALAPGLAALPGAMMQLFGAAGAGAAPAAAAAPAAPAAPQVAVNMASLPLPPVAPRAADSPWNIAYLNPVGVGALQIAAGSYLECATKDSQGVIDGTALLYVLSGDPPDHGGQFLKAVFAGASAKARANELKNALNLAGSFGAWVPRW